MHQFLSVMAASMLACGVTSLGIFLISRRADWSQRNAVFFMAFASGVLITVSFLHLIPKALETNPRGALFLLMGFFALYLLNLFLDRHVRRTSRQIEISLGITPVLGIGLHSLIDGLIFAVTFNVSMFTGLLAAVGMIFHEFPEGVITFVLLEEGGFKRRQAVLYAFLAAAVSTPLGALISYPLLRQISSAVLGGLLAFSAGALVYVGATHLLPEVENHQRPYRLAALSAGVLVGLVIILTRG